MTLNILCCNVNGLSDYNIRRKFFHYLHLKPHNVIYIQESHSTPHTQKSWKTQWGGDIYFSHGTSKARGVCILIKRNFHYQLINSRHDDQGRSIELRILHEDHYLTLLNIYAPNEDSPDFFKEIFETILPIYKQNLIIAGDWNLVLDVHQDKKARSLVTNKRAQLVVKTYMDEMGLVDVWRTKNPDILNFTHESQYHDSASRLDFFLVSDNLTQYVNKAGILPGFASDHSFPELTLMLNQIQRGPGVWKMNATLLRDKRYIETINKLILDQSFEEYQSARHRWEVLKMLIRSETIKISIERSRDRKLRLSILEKRLSQIDAQRHNNPNIFPDPSEVREHLIKLKSEIDELLTYKTQGAILRSRIDYTQAGEKPSKYFFNLEKTKASKKAMNRLVTQAGASVNTQNEIQDEQLAFFSHLYRDKNIQPDDIDQYLQNLQSPKLTQKQREDLDLPIRMPELAKALFDMPNGKTPGPDGIIVDFYKVFWDKIKLTFWDALKESWKFGFDRDMLASLIALIPKKDKDPIYLSNWRPISLINCDYKIVTKALANRLGIVLPSIIHQDQKGFIKGRFIGENLFDLSTIIDYCDSNDIPALILNFDLLKAFDSLSHVFLDRALNFFGFGPIFRNYITTLYTGISASVLSNGYCSKPFPILGGLRQGCGLSPGNFILSFEILCLKLRQNPDIQGIQISNEFMKKLGVFADDLWSIILGTQENVDNLFTLFHDFGVTSGLSINYDKTQILRVGSLRDSNAMFYTVKPLHWVEELRILGINIGKKSSAHSNYDNLIDKVKSLITLWSSRHLTIMGKILLCNTLLTSQWIYKLLMVITPPQNLFYRYKRLILDFIWDSKPPRIRYKKLIKNKLIGGLGLIDLELKDLSLKASWVPRILQANPTTSWVIFVYFHLPIKDPLIWECNITTEWIKALFDIQVFSIQIWAAWAHFNATAPKSRDDVLNQCLWYNSHILRNEKPWLSRSLYHAGLIYIYHLYDETRDRFFSAEELAMIFRCDYLMEINSLLTSVPNQWKQMLKQAVSIPPQIPLAQSIVSKKQLSSYFYKILCNRIVDPDGCQNSWEFDLNTEISDAEWARANDNVFQVTTTVYLRCFQYRLLNRVLTTNVLRSKYTPTEPYCTFCKNSPEIITHLFFDCPIVNKFWKTLQKWIKYIFKISYSFDRVEIILNTVKAPKAYRSFLNKMVLMAKQYIYATKCLQAVLNFSHFIDKVTKAYNVDKLIAY